MIAAALSLALLQPAAPPYRPVACQRRGSYAGSPLHPAMDARLPAPLAATALPAETIARLGAAFERAQRLTRA